MFYFTLLYILYISLAAPQLPQQSPTFQIHHVWLQFNSIRAVNTCKIERLGRDFMKSHYCIKNQQALFLKLHFNHCQQHWRRQTYVSCWVKRHISLWTTNNHQIFKMFCSLDANLCKMFHVNSKSLFHRSQLKTLWPKSPIKQNLLFHQDGWSVSEPSRSIYFMSWCNIWGLPDTVLACVIFQ